MKKKNFFIKIGKINMKLLKINERVKRVKDFKSEDVKIAEFSLSSQEHHFCQNHGNAKLSALTKRSTMGN